MSADQRVVSIDAFPDFTGELAQLLSYISDVATAIRMNSPYSGKPSQSGFPPQSEQTRSYDVMWLSDSLHNLSILGVALVDKDIDQVLWACEMLIAMYKDYPTIGDPSRPVQPSESFKRWEHLDISFDRALGLFEAIRGKTLAHISGAGGSL